MVGIGFENRVPTKRGEKTMKSRRSRRQRVLLAGIFATALLGSSAPALAGPDRPSPNASCQGILSVANSTGQIDVSRADVAQYFALVHKDGGPPPGVIMSMNGRTKEGNVDDCLAPFS